MALRILTFVCVLWAYCGQIEGNPSDLLSLTLSKTPAPLSLSYVKKESKGGLSKDKLSVKPPLTIKKQFIMIDAGHGGHDQGAQSISKPRYQEKSLNLVTAQFIQSYLQQLGYKVLMTRQDDRFISLEQRAQMANQEKVDLFVSIHYNSAPSSEAEGVEVFFYQSKQNKGRTATSKKLAQFVLKNILTETQAKSRKVKNGNFAVIRETEMPAILVEGGFMTNETELQRLKDPVYLKKIAWGIVKGIEEYCHKGS